MNCKEVVNVKINLLMIFWVFRTIKRKRVFYCWRFESKFERPHEERFKGFIKQLSASTSIKIQFTSILTRGGRRNKKAKRLGPQGNEKLIITGHFVVLTASTARSFLLTFSPCCLAFNWRLNFYFIAFSSPLNGTIKHRSSVLAMDLSWAHKTMS